MKSRQQLKLATRRRAHFRITESARRELQKLVFQRHPRREWGTFFRFGFRRTTWGVALSYVDSLGPLPSDLDRNSGIVSFRSAYIDRVLDELDSSPLAIGVIHSHPSGAQVTPSGLDDDMDHHFGGELFPPFAPGRPYASLIVNQTSEGKLIFSGRVFIDGEWLPIATLHSGEQILQKYTSELISSAKSALERDSLAVLQRWISLVGEAKATQLRSSVIGVVGCSGTGSPAVEALARSQIGEFVLIDPDKLAISNIERLHGSRLSDLHKDNTPYKVEIMARLIREVNPDAKLTLIAGNSMDDLSMNELLRCDIVLFCTDTVHGRVHASDLASRYLIPVIDVGILPEGKDGKMISQMIEIMRLSPEGACSFCRNRVDPLELHRELMSPSDVEIAKREAVEAAHRGDRADTYWKEDLPQLPSVGYLTTAAGSLVSGYALNWILGTAKMPHDHFQLDVGLANFGFTPIENDPKPGCSCSMFRGHSYQGEPSIVMPPHFPPAILITELHVKTAAPEKRCWWRKFLRYTKRFLRPGGS